MNLFNGKMKTKVIILKLKKMKTKSNRWIIALAVPVLVFASTLMGFMGSQGSENVRFAQIMLIGTGGFALGVLYKNLVQLFRNPNI